MVMLLYGWKPLTVSHHLTTFNSRDITYLICQVTTCLEGFVTYVWKPLIVTQHLAKFIGYRPCGCRDTLYLIYL